MLADHLRSQLSVLVLSDQLRDAADLIIGNLDDNGYLTVPLEELGAGGEIEAADLEAALKVVQSLDPAGVGARDVRECLMLQLESRNARGGVAWRIVSEHLNLIESRQFKELARDAREADRAHPDRGPRHPRPRSHGPACATRGRGRGKWNRMSSSPRTAPNMSSS